MLPPVYNPDSPISILEERHVITTILFLKKKGRCKKTDVYFNISLNSRMPAKLDRMEIAGIITQTYREEGRRTDVELTPYGERIAVALEYLNSVIMTRPPEEVERYIRGLDH